MKPSERIGSMIERMQEMLNDCIVLSSKIVVEYKNEISKAEQHAKKSEKLTYNTWEQPEQYVAESQCEDTKEIK